ncbi:MAG: MnhB domain-containing protein [Acidiphilium sp.]
MTPRARKLVFALACMIVLPAMVHVALHMPRFGAHPLPYGDAINHFAPIERHVTNMVSAVNFDYRGVDTLGEEFMLLCAVTGTTVLLRGIRGENIADRPGQVPGRRMPKRSEGLMLACRMFGVLIIVFGVYVVLHAMTTPGGGFQGGAIVASGTLLIFLGETYRGWRFLMRSEMLDAVEGAGATLFALAGFAAMVAGKPFLHNILPLGQPRDLFSGGLMLVENFGTALAVAGGFSVLFLEFLEETRVDEGDGD